MIRQIESIQNLAKSKIKLSHDANARCKRQLCIKSSTKLVLKPHETSLIPIHSQTSLSKANFMFTPQINEHEPMKFIHVQEAMINSETPWLPIHNTSHELKTIPQNTILGYAIELSEYDIAQPDTLDYNIDSVKIYCMDNSPIENPWNVIENDPDIVASLETSNT